MSDESLDAIAEEVRTWDRWGADGRGAVAGIDAEAVHRGLAAAVDGRPVPLSLPGPVGGRGSQRAATRLGPGPDGVDVHDDLVVEHPERRTCWAAPSHLAVDGLRYGGHPAAVVDVERGATVGGADRIGPVVTRGILLDLARTLVVDRLAPGEVVTPGHLDEALARAATLPAPGDVVLLRTGHGALLRDGGEDAWSGGHPGLAPGCIRWFLRAGVAGVAVDCPHPDPVPAPTGDPASGAAAGFHRLATQAAGLLVGRCWDLEALADACAGDHRSASLLSATPHAVPGTSVAAVAAVAVR